MKNHFKINYDTKIITLHFEGQDFEFNLDEGDVGDMWNSFSDKNDICRDVNFSQEDETQKPMLSVYDLQKSKLNGLDETNTSSQQEIELIEQSGNPLNYFK